MLKYILSNIWMIVHLGYDPSSLTYDGLACFIITCDHVWNDLITCGLKRQPVRVCEPVITDIQLISICNRIVISELKKFLLHIWFSMAYFLVIVLFTQSFRLHSPPAISQIISCQIQGIHAPTNMNWTDKLNWYWLASWKWATVSTAYKTVHGLLVMWSAPLVFTLQFHKGNFTSLLDFQNKGIASVLNMNAYINT